MGLRVYAVCIPEIRASNGRIWGDPPEPPEYGVPVGIFVAHSHGQAKWLALGAWAYRGNDIGVDTDDFPNIRARIIGYEDDAGYDDGTYWHPLPVGEFKATSGPMYDAFWSRWPEEWTNL